MGGAIQAGEATDYGLDGADFWLMYNGVLPEYYINKEEAELLGWERWRGNLFIVAPSRMIGGDTYYNDNGHLPDAPGRIWYEADINYRVLWRNTQRVVYSNDGLIFVTYDHFKTFHEIV